MKKNPKIGKPALRLQETELASVRGAGISGGASPEAIVGGGRAPADDGVIISRN